MLSAATKRLSWKRSVAKERVETGRGRLIVVDALGTWYVSLPILELRKLPREAYYVPLISVVKSLSQTVAASVMFWVLGWAAGYSFGLLPEEAIVIAMMAWFMGLPLAYLIGFKMLRPQPIWVVRRLVEPDGDNLRVRLVPVVPRSLVDNYLTATVDGEEEERPMALRGDFVGQIFKMNDTPLFKLRSQNKEANKLKLGSLFLTIFGMGVLLFILIYTTGGAGT